MPALAVGVVPEAHVALRAPSLEEAAGEPPPPDEAARPGVGMVPRELAGAVRLPLVLQHPQGLQGGHEVELPVPRGHRDPVLAADGARHGAIELHGPRSAALEEEEAELAVQLGPGQARGPAPPKEAAGVLAAVDRLLRDPPHVLRPRRGAQPRRAEGHDAVARLVAAAGAVGAGKLAAGQWHEGEHAGSVHQRPVDGVLDAEVDADARASPGGAREPAAVGSLSVSPRAAFDAVALTGTTLPVDVTKRAVSGQEAT
eukprot:CAMPEP_0204529358 /NCGR_PEP_ID=MMETSP0661-20131031/10022_1 /ASSEMBLY_ACC=CAM_ASM_000606 /TAXON_ID=109239 /ORGANISM="Alexandrium margalefi, Strain AMGDE01CS-322" /LENGTH=256 /DNA_ID=CAMNT_0051535377 /DNA_START=319 /DNA_END=1087 /DNA_ORIENTATION=+